MGRPQLPGSKPETGGEEMLEMILEFVLMILRIAQAVIELVELLISRSRHSDH